jgi:hypothetical protein
MWLFLLDTFLCDAVFKRSSAAVDGKESKGTLLVVPVPITRSQANLWFRPERSRRTALNKRSPTVSVVSLSLVMLLIVNGLSDDGKQEKGIMLPRTLCQCVLR